MALYSVRLRRALPFCSSLFHHRFHSPKVISPINSIAPALSATPNPQNPGASQFYELQSFRLFRSSPVSLSSRRQRFDEEMEINENTILFEGCDYNHWLITVDTPKDTPAADKIATYEHIAAQVFGSMEEAKKKIYACSTTVYDGFQVECSEETSEKFKDVPGVVFVLPDSYIDPVNKQYGGDKYINGEIIHMPPPISYMRRDSRPRHQRNVNRGPMPAYENRGQMQGEARNFGPPQNPPRQQNFGAPQGHAQQQNFGPPQGHPQQQNFGPPQGHPHQQNFGPPQGHPHQQNFDPPPHQQNFSPPQSHLHQQNFGPPPDHQNFGPPQSHLHQQNFGPSQNPPQQQNFGPSQNPPQQQNFGPPRNPTFQQNFTPPQNPSFQQNLTPPQNPSFQQNFNPPQSPQQNFGPHRGPGSQQNHPFPQNAPPLENYGVQEEFTPQQNSSSPGIPSQQSYGPPGGIGHKDSTLASGVWDHNEAGRRDFQQQDQTAYASSTGEQVNYAATGFDDLKYQGRH